MEERQEGGEHRPPQFRVQSEGALTYEREFLAKPVSDSDADGERAHGHSGIMPRPERVSATGAVAPDET